MNDRQIREGNMAVMMAATLVAFKFAEALIAKGVLTRDEGQAVLNGIAQDLRDDGASILNDNNDAGPVHTVAAGLEAMATGL